MARKSRNDWQGPYLKALTQGRPKSVAAAMAGVHRKTPEKYRDRYPEFAEAEEVAYEMGTAYLLDIADERIKSIDRPGDSILLRLLAVRGMHEKHHVTLAGDKDAPLVVSSAVLGADE